MSSATTTATTATRRKSSLVIVPINVATHKVPYQLQGEDHSLPINNTNCTQTINWRTRIRTHHSRPPPPTLIPSTHELPISGFPHHPPDSTSTPINSPYLTQFISHWAPFPAWTLLRPTPFSSDIVQGLLGNCWFLSALALVAERTSLLRRILPTTAEEFEKTRRATVRLFKAGRWHSVTVDDTLPVNSAGQLVFSQAKRSQLFVPLIEKALAKLYGGYERLRGGLTSEGMTLLTGSPCEILWFPPNDRRHDGVERGPAALEQEMDELWIKMVSYASAGFLLGVSCGRGDGERGDGALGPKVDYKKLGLLKEHAYSVLDVVSLGNLRLVKLRNPWGTLVWNGDWSDRSELWTTKLRSDLVPEGAEEGIFWISLIDLCAYFEMIIICKIRPNWFQYTFEGTFPGSIADTQAWTVYELVLDDRLIADASCTQAELSATLYQGPNPELESQTPKLAIFTVIYELLNSNATPIIGPYVGSSICNAQNAITCEAELKRGRRYLVGVFCFNNWNPKDPGTEKPRPSYVLKLASSKPILIDSFTPSSVLLGDMITYFVKATGNPILRPNVITYQLNNDWAGLVSVVENQSPSLWLQVSMKTSLKPTTRTSPGSSCRRASSGSISGPSESMAYSHHLLSASSEDVHQSEHEETTVLKSGPGKTGPEAMSATEDKEYLDRYYLASTRNTLVTRDLIPPGHCQLINVITNQRPITRQHISIKLNFRFHSFQTWCQKKLAPTPGDTSQRPIDLFHQPSINDPSGFIYGFHCPRSTW